MKDLDVADLIIFIGIIAIIYGLALIYMPLAFIIGGILVMLMGFVLANYKSKKQKAGDD
ncbi:hypothetical protein [Paenalkalicoccus suaedae]|uniref:hypothetical protein n=1 Tax=Paenalkalicoccus suaedae TaxID=2592382 RepID=UPI00201C9989|nr:hypothetical protein [Paenalkalicoccus suaedae]